VESIRRLNDEKALFTKIIAGTVFANILALATSLFVIQVLNRYVSFGVDSTLLTLVVGVSVAVIFELMFRLIRVQMIDAVNVKPDRELSQETYDQMSIAKLHGIEKCSVGMRDKLIADVDAVKRSTSADVVTAILDLPFSILFIFVIALIKVPLAIVTIISAVILVLLTLRSLALAKKHMPEITAMAMLKSNLSTTVINEPGFIRLFNLFGVLNSNWKKIVSNLYTLMARLELKQQTIKNLMVTVMAFNTVMIIALGAKYVVLGDLSVGGLIGCNILSARALLAISRFNGIIGVLVATKYAEDRLKEFHSLPQELQEGKALTKYKGNVLLKDFTFTYEGAPSPLFEGFDMEFLPGKFYAVTGPIATGKTTFLNLILNLLELNRGQIFVDGVDLRQISSLWWRQQLIYLPQEISLIDGTILENITVSNPKIEGAVINELLRRCDLREYFSKTKNWLDEPVINQGKNLSTGIKRRLALARALAVDGQLVVLDEPTEGMDPCGKEMLYSLIDEFISKKKTLIVATFDEKLIGQADHVIDLEQKPIPKIKDKVNEMNIGSDYAIK
jgi:ATP-binding cassette subfamily C protein LapB